MKKIFNKIICLTMVTILVFGAAPLSGFVGLELPDFSFFNIKAEAATSGTFGDNLTWSFDSDSGELVISGSGKMDNFNNTSLTNHYPTPWSIYDKEIKKVIINDGVTTIGSEAFNNLTELKSVSMSNTVNYIGYKPFNSSLTDFYFNGSIADWCQIKFNNHSSNPSYAKANLYINGDIIEGDFVIPDNVTSISDFAFCGIDGITSLTISDSVTVIGKDSFSNCSGLTDVIIGDGVKVIDEYAFGKCDSLKTVTIGKAVNNIEKCAFYYCSKLSEVVIGEGVEIIGDNTFSGCNDLSEIIIPPNVKNIGDSAFSYCTKLKSIIIPDNVCEIGEYAFESCLGLTDISISSNVSSIKSGMFRDCTSLKNITIPEGVTSIEYRAFYNCTALEEITLPKSIANIDSYAFFSCNSIINVNYKGDLAGWCKIIFADNYSQPMIKSKNLYIDGNLISGDVVIPENVKSIGNWAFYRCTDISSITITDNVERIGEYAFAGCKDLTSVRIGKAVKQIENQAFAGCDLLTDVYAFSNNWYTIKYINDTQGTASPMYYADNLYIDTVLVSGEVEIPYGVTEIGDYVFKNCSKITSITIPNTVKRIGEEAFSNCSMLSEIVIPESVEIIDTRAFEYCTELTDINISESVVSIGYCAFGGCEKLANIYIPDSVDYISSNSFSGTAFYNNQSNWQNGVLYIDNHLIEARRNIAGDYIVKSGTKTIADSAFRQCENLTAVILPDSLRTINEWAFYECTNLETINIPEGITIINNKTFYKCYNLMNVLIPDSVNIIGEDAFYNCDNLTSVIIPENATYIGDGAFNSCDGIKNVIIPDSVTKIVSYVFANCSNLEEIKIGNNVSEIPSNAFWNCTNLTKVYIPNGVTSIGVCAFDTCVSLTEIIIPDSVTNIGSAAFNDCEKLTKIKLPQNLKEVGNKIINYYNELDILFPGTQEEWNEIILGDDNYWVNNLIFECDSERPYYDSGICGDNLKWKLYADGELVISGNGDMYNYGFRSSPWYYNSKIESVTIENGVTSIGDETFVNCYNLRAVNVPESLIYIGNNAFLDSGISNNSSYWHNSLLYVGCHLVDIKLYTGKTYRIIKEGTKSISKNVFKNCAGIEQVYIPASVEVIPNFAFVGTNAKIVCYKNSFAHQYALNNNIDFELIEVSFDKTSLILKKGDNTVINATVKDDYIVPVEYIWKTSNADVATVDSNGKVTAINYGEAIISVVSSNGIVFATCSVKILPTEPAFADVIKMPTETTISYGDAIILHVDKSKIPVGGRVEWTADNGNFVYSANGETCKINPNKTGDTTFTVVVYDSYGNAVSTDSQTMTSKAGFFDKIIAFFKGLFGMTKTIPQVFKSITKY